METIGTGVLLMIGFYLAPIIIVGCLTVLAIVVGVVDSLFESKK